MNRAKPKTKTLEKSLLGNVTLKADPFIAQAVTQVDYEKDALNIIDIISRMDQCVTLKDQLSVLQECKSTVKV
jgi:hypothetical protein